jgi:hypothetical protein
MRIEEAWQAGPHPDEHRSDGQDSAGCGALISRLRKKYLLHGGLTAAAKEAAEKLFYSAKSSPQALKRERIFNVLRHE